MVRRLETLLAHHLKVPHEEGKKPFTIIAHDGTQHHLHRTGVLTIIRKAIANKWKSLRRSQ